MPGLEEALGREFRDRRGELWDMAYRLTGTVADADDVLQETFARALATPPADTSAPWFPWLLRVAMNVGRDVLRRRKRRGYAGPWLPEPLETSGGAEPPPGPTAEQRYDLRESASYAFLLTLEALSPTARAVIVLRDVFDLTVAETAAALAISEASVRTTHHRGRRALEAYDRRRRRTVPAEAQALLGRLLAAVEARDLAAVRSLLALDVSSITDANGEYIAASRPVEGQDRVARFLLGLGALGTGVESARVTQVNEAPALLVTFTEARRPGDAPRMLLACETGDGVVTRLYWVLATEKLAHLSFGAAAAARSPPG